jgi:hypothetical protein
MLCPCGRASPRGRPPATRKRGGPLRPCCTPLRREALWCGAVFPRLGFSPCTPFSEAPPFQRGLRQGDKPIRGTTARLPLRKTATGSRRSSRPLAKGRRFREPPFGWPPPPPLIPLAPRPPAGAGRVGRAGHGSARLDTWPALRGRAMLADERTARRTRGGAAPPRSPASLSDPAFVAPRRRVTSNAEPPEEIMRPLFRSAAWEGGAAEQKSVVVQGWEKRAVKRPMFGIRSRWRVARRAL